jgi:hypothetical protein
VTIEPAAARHAEFRRHAERVLLRDRRRNSARSFLAQCLGA